MLEPGQTVLYGTEGICTIEAIETLRIGGKRSKYYVLRPVYRTRATIYVPTDNELLSAYAAWMYRQRASESPMPTYLRYALNNRIVSASTAAQEGTV